MFLTFRRSLRLHKGSKTVLLYYDQKGQLCSQFAPKATSPSLLPSIPDPYRRIPPLPASCSTYFLFIITYFCGHCQRGKQGESKTFHFRLNGGNHPGFFFIGGVSFHLIYLKPSRNPPTERNHSKIPSFYWIKPQKVEKHYPTDKLSHSKEEEEADITPSCLRYVTVDNPGCSGRARDGGLLRTMAKVLSGCSIPSQR